jgi:L-iditol 2-dehydrogenase
MKAAYLVEPGSIEIRDVDPPRASAGELIVDVECALTCGTDLKAFRRGHPFIPMPGPFGHQYSGRVREIGSGLSGFEVGMPILGVHSGPCGECRPCRSRRPNLCDRLQDQLVIGAFAEQLRISPRVAAQNVHPRPAILTALRAAFLEPVSCVVHSLSLLDFRSVERTLVLGLGSMGLLFLQILPFYSPSARVAAGRRVPRLAMARSLGVDETIDTDAGEWGRGYDLVIECTGRPEGWQQAIDLVEPGGQVMLFGGLPKGSTFPIDTYRLHYEELRVLGCFHFTPADVARSTELLAEPGLKLEEMIEESRPLAGLEQSLNDMAEGRGIKYAIEPGR